MEGIRNFHDGEIQLQRESGVDTEAFDAMVEGAFQPEFAEVEARFASGRTFSVAATIDADGRSWASPLIGQAGEMLRVESATSVRISQAQVDGDPLFDNVAETGELGVLYFDPSLRRRMKSNGKATIADGPIGVIDYEMHRNFGICNKYIFKRKHEPPTDASTDVPQGEKRAVLNEADRDQLSLSDTIFLASFHVDHGADPTHRGGPAGFVTVVDDATISMPDYMGNGMFQTLGNILLDDRIGLMSLDFRTGRALHLTGCGSIEASPIDDEYSIRTLVIAIDEVRTSYRDPGSWIDVEEFPLRPGLINPATPYLRSPR